MTSRPLYQAAVAELEGVLSPRVVSRSLKEGLAQIGTTPDELDISGLERILKGQVYRQLQVTMPSEQAKEAITEMLARLRQHGNGSVDRTPTPAPLDGQQAAVAELKEAMRPFNLYFEWPEVQKLRAQIKLLESEQKEGREAGNLLREAREQLRVISQKLEDELVIQARDIGELEVMIDGVRALGGPKLRRLENLLGQVREAQQQRQLAAAEVERARRLGADLRKLLESSVLTNRESAPPDDGAVIEIDTDSGEEPLTVVQDEQLEQDVHARLLQIDLESEQHELGAIESAHRHLLEHRPELGRKFEELREKLAAGETLGERMSGLRDELDAATADLQRQLTAELQQIGDDALRVRHQVDTGELSQAVQVAQGVLETTLPALHDMRRIRDLHQHATERAGEAEAHEAAAEDERQAKLREQGAAIERMSATLGIYRDDPSVAAQVEALQDGLSALQAAHGQQEPVPELLAAVRRSEERLRAAAGGDGDGGAQTPRGQAQALLADVEALPLLPEMRERAASISQRLGALAEQEAGGSADQLAELELLLKALRLELRDAHAERLEAARLEAVRLGESSTLEKIATAQEQLSQGEFPGLHEIEGKLRGAVDRRRQEELSELRTLELEAGRFAGLGLSGYDELSALLEEASLRPDSDSLLSRAWLQLEALRSTVEQRLESVEGRLDRSLNALARVEKLNSEDVEEARRILQHLDGQRASLGRVSLGLRLELEDSLQHAERLLEKLKEEYEATRAIADQLVSGNFIDDMLGLLGSDEPRPEEDAESETAPPPPVLQQGEPAEARSDNARLNAWVDGYLAEEGVKAVALLGAGGELVSGRLHSEPGATRDASDELMKQLAQLGSELARGAPQLATVEMGSLALVTSRPLDGHRLLVLLESSSAMSRVLHRLRRELAEAPARNTDDPPLTD